VRALIVLVIIIGLAAVAGSLIVGSRTFDGKVTERPYETGLAWDRLQKEKEASGLSFSLKNKEYTLGENEVIFAVLDREGKPFTGVVRSLVVSRPATASYDRTYPLASPQHGLYRLPVHLPLPGYWDLKAQILHQGRELLFEERIYAGPAPLAAGANGPGRAAFKPPAVTFFSALAPIKSVYILMFVAGLLGSLGHCLGMCGPIVAACSFHIEKGRLVPHLLYNLGRVATYGILGAVMGLTGSFAGVAGAWQDFPKLALAGVGLVMALMGLSLLGYLPGLKKLAEINPLSPLVLRSLKLFSRDGGTGAFFPLGLLMGFIPCGLLYTAFIAAAGAGVEAGDRVLGLVRGLFMLLLFGVGTMPALLILGSTLSRLREGLRGWFYRAAALSMIGAGIIFLYRAGKF